MGYDEVGIVAYPLPREAVRSGLGPVRAVELNGRGSRGLIGLVTL
jgi:hypothetical protein